MFAKLGFRLIEENEVPIGEVVLKNFTMEFVRMNAALPLPKSLK
jgi:hypothetical protein